MRCTSSTTIKPAGERQRPLFLSAENPVPQEAAWWSEVFSYAEDRFSLPRGTIKATLLIETLPAVFQMHEILHALRDHIVGLNCGRWDYIFSYIKTLKTMPTGYCRIVRL